MKNPYKDLVKEIKELQKNLEAQQMIFNDPDIYTSFKDAVYDSNFYGPEPDLETAGIEKTEDSSVEAYFPPEIFRPFILKLSKKLNEDECKALIQILASHISKEDYNHVFSPSIETAILSVMVDKA